MLTSAVEDEQNQVVDDGHFDPGAAPEPIVEKQYGGTKGRVLELKINSNVNANGSVQRQKFRGFVELAQIEPLYHAFGVFGFFHPKLGDFTVDPTNQFGYTINRPTKAYNSGSESVNLTVRMSVGGALKLAGP